MNPIRRLDIARQTLRLAQRELAMRRLNPLLSDVGRFYEARVCSALDRVWYAQIAASEYLNQQMEPNHKWCLVRRPDRE